MSYAYAIEGSDNIEVVTTPDRLKPLIKSILKDRRMWVNEPIKTTVGQTILQKSYVIKFTDANGFVDTYFNDITKVPFNKVITMEDGFPTPYTVRDIYEWVQKFLIIKIQTEGDLGYIEFWHEYMADKSLSQEKSEGYMTFGILG